MGGGLSTQPHEAREAPTLAEQRPRVLVCSAWPPAVGGAVSFALRLCEHPAIVAQVQIERHQILKRPSIFVRSEAKLAASPVGRPLRVGCSAWNLLRYVVRLRQHRPAVVQYHYNAPFEGGLLSEVCTYLRLARSAGARTVVRLGAPFHFFDLDPASPQGVRIRAQFLPVVDRLAVQAPAWAAAYDAWFERVGATTRALTVPNTVDVASITPRPEGLSAGVPLRVGCIAGPETRIKGAEVVLAAVASCLARGPIPLRIEAVNASDEFVRAVERAGLGTAIAPLPALGGQPKWDWLRSLDLYLLPSLMEGFPNALLEAMACRVPVIATAVGAVPSVVSHERDGLLIPPGDAVALERAMLRLVADPLQRERLAVAGRQTVSERFDLRGDWYRELLEAWLAPPRRDS